MFNPNGVTTLYCVDAMGNWHRLTANIAPLGPRSDLLMAAASEEGHVIPNFAHVGELPVHAYAGKDPALAVRLPFLRLRTYFHPMGSGENIYLVPWFSPEESVDIVCEWTPPYNCDLFFVMRAGKCYLVAGHTAVDGRRTLRKLPLPNVHDDAAICMGDWRITGTTMLEKLNSAITGFVTSEWNTDLLSNKRTYLSQFMRFSPDGRRQLPAITSWDNYSPIVAGASYNWVASLMVGTPTPPPPPPPVAVPVSPAMIAVDTAIPAATGIQGFINEAAATQEERDHNLLRALAERGAPV